MEKVFYGNSKKWTLKSLDLSEMDVDVAENDAPALQMKLDMRSEKSEVCLKKQLLFLLCSRFSKRLQLHMLKD